MSEDKYTPEAARELLEQLRRRHHVISHNWMGDELQVTVMKGSGTALLTFPLDRWVEDKDMQPSPAEIAAQTYGGLTEPPTVVRNRVRPDEVINHTPQTAAGKSAYALVPIYPPVQPVVVDLEAEPVTVVQLMRHQWQTTEWVSTEPATFDAKTNRLVLHGYYRLHRFDVWKQDDMPEAAEEGEGE